MQTKRKHTDQQRDVRYFIRSATEGARFGHYLTKIIGDYTIVCTCRCISHPSLSWRAAVE